MSVGVGVNSGVSVGSNVAVAAGVLVAIGVGEGCAVTMMTSGVSVGIGARGSHAISSVAASNSVMKSRGCRFMLGIIASDDKVAIADV